MPAIAPPRLRAVNLACAVAAAAIAALAWMWAAVWLLWLVAIVAGLAWTRRDSRARVECGGAAAAIAWSVGLGLLSLLLVDPDADDAHYVHLSTWVADRGRFPVRDVLFSDERFDALFFPPWSAIEGLAGTAARLTGIPAPTVVYLVLGPAATVLSVLALWRLLRAWAVPMAAVALSTSLVFLLADEADEVRTVGHFFIGRPWQGKAMFVALLVPLVFALLHEYVRRPGRRGLVLLAAAGVAGVGLSSTALLVIPIIAIGGLAPFARDMPRAALQGLAATAAYPVLAAAIGAVIGMRNPDLSHDGAVAGELAHQAIGTGVPAFLTVAAIVAAPVLLRRPAGRVVAGVALLVGVLQAPGVPAVIGAATGFGESLWRITWALPVAALVGAAATSVRGSPLPAVRALPAAAMTAALVAWAVHAGPFPGTTIAATPALKRPSADLDDARAILARAQPGDLVLAPQGVSVTLLVLSARVTTVDPRDFYTFALGRTRGRRRAARPLTRVRLQGLADPALPLRRDREPVHRDAAFVAHALRILDVDIACVRRGQPVAVRTLRAAGYSRRFTTPRLACLRA